MNNVFSLNRFLLLARGHFKKNLKTYVVSCLVFAGVTFGLFYLLISSKRAEVVTAGDQFAIYVIVIYGGLFIFSASIFQPFQHARERIFQLLLPASRFEKFLLAWLVSLVGYTACANGIFFVARYGVLQYYMLKGYEVSAFPGYSWLLHQKDGETLAAMFGMIYVFIHAFALVGSMIFRKIAVLKASFLLLLVLAGYWIFIGTLFKTLFPQVATTASLLPFTPLHITNEGTSYTVAISGWLYWLLALSLVIIGLLWLAAYHKLREKEA
ncbi:hypothetical protein [Parapedobacter indicus]|uniref:ABC-2 family transporter protein n=1 Tax=Parapedobacter indicus TaxID=1477437 RepID=A0A1I3IJF1_9SPHI|nr:hypothetical protein [Parapedobacter indicus]PPL02193.1 hypothetical protein CLV26_104118 [Parapedobacter indicus]SFI48052.1 hypothetical protein SAMN05444682_104118 [Parapedobacter indicus]